MEFVNEHTLIGQIGHFFVLLSFIAAVAAAVSYYYASKEALMENSWRKIARTAFSIHAAATVILISLVFFMIINRYYEYNYVWKQTNNGMEFRYIFSSFWGGQEGSLMLWSFWHVILGLILMFRAKNWEAPVMTTYSAVQAFIMSMLMGVYILDVKMGNSPFALIRELPDNLGLPWTQSPTYLELPAFADGRGLNPLLQNYWMTIHPPTLFLGFASTLVPFCYAIAALWKQKQSEWIKPALPWAFFSVMVFGIGILMGGAWAYEALSFGGFWAWDPVENASLVPWLTVVGGAHVMLVAKAKKKNSFSATILILATFLLVLYSTFLTRSGVLGNASVHSFTGDGLMVHLLLFLLFFTWLSISLLIKNGVVKVVYNGLVALLFLAWIVAAFYQSETGLLIILDSFVVLSFAAVIAALILHLFKDKEEDHIWSREFWMFIGALLLALSAFQIILTTSFPVINKIFGSNFAGFSIEKYNRWQLPFAALICILIAFTQFLKYKQTSPGVFFKKIIVSIIGAAALTTFFGFNLSYSIQHEWHYLILVFASSFAVIANIDYFIRFLKGKLNFAGSTIAHIGFGLVLLGALLSTSRSQFISQDLTAVEVSTLGESMDDRTSMLLTERDTFPMGEYFVIYKGRRTEAHNMYYDVEYFHQAPAAYQKGDTVIVPEGIYRAKNDHLASAKFSMDAAQWEPVETKGKAMQSDFWTPYQVGEFAFMLSPKVQKSEKFENSPDPDTKHFMGHDIYTHVQWADLSDPNAKDTLLDEDGYTRYKSFQVKIGDTVAVSTALIRIDSISPIPTDAYDQYAMAITDVGAVVHSMVVKEDGSSTPTEGLLILRDSILPVTFDVALPEHELRLRFGQYKPEEGKFQLDVSLKPGEKQDMIVLQAIVFPYINILWLGCVLMFIGTLMAVRFRIRQNKRSAA